ncbi:MAG: PAC2 family protein [Phototrophicaceae bacterium]
MTESIQLQETPQAEVMIVGWRQWADAGSVSSLLPKYLVRHLNARRIGELRSDGFYLFQIPGTHDLVRPIVRFRDGYPEELERQRNDLYFAEVNGKGVAIFIGDEPHLDAERYTQAIVDIAQRLGNARLISLGGVYAQLPFDKPRPIHTTYSLQRLRPILEEVNIHFTGYQGGASIGAYLARVAAERNHEYIGMYAFVPTLNFAQMPDVETGFRIESDYRAWIDVLRRLGHFQKLKLDLTELQHMADDLQKTIDRKIAQLDEQSPELGLRDMLDRMSQEFTPQEFDPRNAVWEEALRDLLDDDEE